MFSHENSSTNKQRITQIYSISNKYILTLDSRVPQTMQLRDATDSKLKCIRELQLPTYLRGGCDYISILNDELLAYGHIRGNNCNLINEIVIYSMSTLKPIYYISPSHNGVTPNHRLIMLEDRYLIGYDLNQEKLWVSDIKNILKVIYYPTSITGYFKYITKLGDNIFAYAITQYNHSKCKTTCVSQIFLDGFENATLHRRATPQIINKTIELIFPLEENKFLTIDHTLNSYNLESFVSIWDFATLKCLSTTKLGNFIPSVVELLPDKKTLIYTAYVSNKRDTMFFFDIESKKTQSFTLKYPIIDLAVQSSTAPYILTVNSIGEINFVLEIKYHTSHFLSQVGIFQPPLKNIITDYINEDDYVLSVKNK